VSYNAHMLTDVAEYYEVLGVEPGADIEAVRLAYRRAAISYHPDNYAGDPVEAERKLRELIEAYRAIARRLDPAAWSRAPSARTRVFSPQDFAREEYATAWHTPQSEGGSSAGRGGKGSVVGQVYVTRDETRTFIFYWALAVVLGIVVGGGAALHRLHHAGLEGLSAGDVLLTILIGEAIYVLAAAGAVVLVILTRKVVRFTLDWIGQRWRFLPGPKKDRSLPGPPEHSLPKPEAEEAKT